MILELRIPKGLRTHFL